MKLLLDKEADLTVANSNGWTPGFSKPLPPHAVEHPPLKYERSTAGQKSNLKEHIKSSNNQPLFRHFFCNDEMCEAVTTILSEPASGISIASFFVAVHFFSV